MGPRLGNGISPCFLAFLRGDRPSINLFLFFREKFLLLVAYWCVSEYVYVCACIELLHLHPQCCSLLVIDPNGNRAGLIHAPQSLLRVVAKLPVGGVVTILSALPTTLAAHRTGPETHSKSNWEFVGFPLHAGLEAPLQV